MAFNTFELNLYKHDCRCAADMIMAEIRLSECESVIDKQAQMVLNRKH